MTDFETHLAAAQATITALSQRKRPPETKHELAEKLRACARHLLRMDHARVHVPDAESGQFVTFALADLEEAASDLETWEEVYRESGSELLRHIRLLEAAEAQVTALSQENQRLKEAKK